MKNIVTITANNYCHSVFDGTHATPKPCPSGYKLITSKNITGDGINISDAYFISEQDYFEINKRSKVYQWDILFSMIGTVGNLYLEENSDIDYAIKNIGVFSCRDEFKAKWLFYYLQSPMARNHIKRFLNGAVQKFLSLKQLRDFPILPFEKDKISIVEILSALDKKIALNKQINARLEEMAKTLYDYWFVQFDFPDANGKPYKSSGGDMVFDETLKREIPKGWEVKSLGEIADLYQPATLSEKELNKNGQFLVYGANGIIGKYNKFNHENPVVAVACRGNSCGAINITQPKSWITGNAMVVNPKNKNMCIDFIKNTLLVNNLDKVVSGSAQPQITRTNFAPLKVITPNESLLKLYSDIINPMFNKRINRIQQNAKLTQLRDFLLPMLMNGQVSVA